VGGAVERPPVFRLYFGRAVVGRRVPVAEQDKRLVILAMGVLPVRPTMVVTSQEVFMQASSPSGEDAERVARHAERPGFRISELRMSPTQQVAWHYHTNIQDTFYVLDGSVRITLRDPDEQVDLQAGESWGPVRPGRPHLVTNNGDGSATLLVLQGMGDWDHIPLA
jgi:quercetin dioxygenase-like cupin family protein